MLFKNSLCFLAAFSGVLVGSASTPASPRCAIAGSGLTPRASFVRVVDAIYNTHEILAARPYFNDDYIQHDADQPDGADVNLQHLIDVGFPNGTFAFQSIIPPCNGNDKAMVHYKFSFAGNSTSISTIDVLRFEGSCVAEHWNVMMPIPTDAVSTHPLLADNLAPKAIVPSCSGD